MGFVQRLCLFLTHLVVFQSIKSNWQHIELKICTRESRDFIEDYLLSDPSLRRTMGCGSSTANAKIVPNKDSVTQRKETGLEASHFQQALVQQHNKENINDVYDINWDDSKALGSGATSTVRQCTNKLTKTVYALKTIELYRLPPEVVASLFEEVSIMRILDHPNVIKVIETFVDFKRLYIVMECCTGGELFDKLYEQPGDKFSESDAKDLATKMLSALNYLHENKIIHRDLKLENFIFTKMGGDGEIKLIDFGLSRSYLEGEHMKKVAGTSYYMAPEVLKGDYSAMADMWSFGVVVFMLLSGRCPFGGHSDNDIQQNVLRGRYVFKKPAWEGVSNEAKDFVTKLLVQKVDNRMTATEALDHPWIVGQAGDNGLSHALSEEGEDHLVQHMREFKKYSDLKRAALLAISFSLGEDEIGEIRKGFQQVDTHHNGVIGHEEFMEVMHKHGVMEDAECERIFQTIDQDHRGVIKYSEFLAACIDEKQYLDDRRVVEAFNRMDTDHTGTITKDNLREILGDDCTEEAIDRMMAQADFHNNGMIDLDEFRRIMKGETAT